MCKNLFYISIVILVLSIILYTKYPVEEYHYINTTDKKKKSKKGLKKSKKMKPKKESKNFNTYFSMKTDLNPDGSIRVSEDQIIDTNGKRYSRNVDYIENPDGSIKMLPVRKQLMC